jgi:hypothetical protein
MSDSHSWVKIYKSDEHDEIRFHGVIQQSEYHDLKLDPMDRWKILDCFNPKDSTAADWLLGLEYIFRRLEQRKFGYSHPAANKSYLQEDSII